MLTDTTSPSCIYFVHLICHINCCYDVASIWHTHVPLVFMLCLRFSWSMFDKPLIMTWLVKLVRLVLHGVVSQYPRISMLSCSGRHGLYRFPRSQCYGQQTRAISISVFPVAFMSLHLASCNVPFTGTDHGHLYFAVFPLNGSRATLKFD
jgi:hypothetical protein